MPKGPRGEKRPADLIGMSITVAKIATGEIPEQFETPESQGKDPAAAALGRRGGRARAEKLTPEQRHEAAKKAAKTRWKKEDA